MSEDGLSTLTDARVRKILVLLAGPEEAETVTTVAVSLSEPGSQVVVVHLAPTASQPPVDGRTWEKVAAMAEKVTRLVERHPEVIVTSSVGIGRRMSRAILRMAEDVDTVVSGRRLDRGGWTRESLFRAVVRRAAADLVLVEDRGAPDRPREVVVGVRPGPRGGVALRAGVRLAQGLDADLRLVTVVTGRTGGSGVDSAWLEGIRRRVVRAGLPINRLKVDVLDGDPPTMVDLLVSQVRSGDLLVIGASPDGIFRRHLLPPVSDQITSRAGCTTLIVTPRRSPPIPVWRVVATRGRDVFGPLPPKGGP